jgi:hypothetical protein
VVQDGDVNVAEAIVAAGLAELMTHGATDDRSSHYDALMAAQVRLPPMVWASLCSEAWVPCVG